MITSSCLNLHVSEKPKFLRLPQDVQEDANQDIKFECEAKGDPAPTIIWKREDGQIPSLRSHIGKDRSLRIDNIKVWGHCANIIATELFKMSQKGGNVIVSH